MQSGATSLGAYAAKLGGHLTGGGLGGVLRPSPKKKYKKPDDKEKRALLNLANKIEKIGTNMPPEEIQTIVYTIGKENGYEKNLREWFKLLYQVLFGDIDGPRMGFFISFFGVPETVKLIKEKIN